MSIEAIEKAAYVEYAGVQHPLADHHFGLYPHLTGLAFFLLNMSGVSLSLEELCQAFSPPSPQQGQPFDQEQHKAAHSGATRYVYVPQQNTAAAGEGGMTLGL